MRVLHCAIVATVPVAGAIRGTGGASGARITLLQISIQRSKS